MSSTAAAEERATPNHGDWRHDRAMVLERMRYWHPPLVEQPPSGQYLTFWPDCGGFNNIRMGFEFAVAIAFATRRTLVLPPPQPWYLIDFGPLTRMKPEPGKPWEGPMSDFSIFFNLSSLRGQVPVMSAAQFLLRERSRLNLPLAELAPHVTRARRRAAAKRGSAASTGPREVDDGGGVHHLHLGHDVTWKSARAACRALGPSRRLCTFEEVCPVRKGARGRERKPWLWAEEGRLQGDHWTPVRDERRRSLHDWVEVGDSAGRQCVRHSLYGLPPPWEESPAADLKGHVFCCRVTGGGSGAAGTPTRTGGGPASGSSWSLWGLGVASAAGGGEPFTEAEVAAALELKGASWWRRQTDAVGTALPWSPLSRYVAWPDVKTVEEASVDDAPLTLAIASRRGVEYDARLRQLPVLHMPSCKKDPSDAYRFLGQMAQAVLAPPGNRMTSDVRQALRDGARYVDVVWQVAARVVAQLGAFRYSALHIRRNDLQYKNVFVSANATLRNVAPLLRDGETLYLATDEKRPEFFDRLRARHPRLIQWRDLYTEAAGHVLQGVDVPRKLVGCIEQVICAMGRRFIGTQHSTFSGYIPRLRGFIGAPDTLIYYHNQPWSASAEMNRRRQPRHDGRNYMDEDSAMWTTTVGREQGRVGGGADR